MKVKLAEGLGDLKEDIVLIRQELVKLGRIVNPLTAITDLSVGRKKQGNGQISSQEELTPLGGETNEA